MSSGGSSNGSGHSSGSSKDSVSLYYPHVATTEFWETEIAIINTSARKTLSGTLMAVGNDGRDGESIFLSLGPHARREIKIDTNFNNPEDIGYIIFMSNSDELCGYAKFYVDGQYRVAIPAISRINESDIYVPHIASTADWTTSISLVNTTSSAKTLTIEFDNGQTDTVILKPGQHFVSSIRKFSVFGGEAQPDIKSAVIKNGDGIIGVELFAHGDWLSGILLKDELASVIYYPHVVSDDKWSTSIVAYNPSDTTCNIDITSYSRTGILLGSEAVSVNGKSKYVGVVRSLRLPTETAWIKLEASYPVTGFELFANRARTQMAGYSSVYINRKQGVFPKLDRNGGTGIAFVNTDGSQATVTLTAYDDRGSVVATKNERLGPYEKLVKIAEDFFAGDISSASYISYSSNREVVGSQFNVSSDGMMLDALPGM
jgi:hypothetical protein